MSRRRAIAVAFCCWLLGGVYTVINAQTVDFTWSAGPVDRALLALADSVDVNLTLPAKLLRDRRVEAGQLRGAPLENVLDALLANTDAAYRRTANGLVLYRRAPVRRTRSGYVTDAESGERLIGAALYDPASGEGCVTNAFGFFSYPFRAGAERVQVSYLGYRTATVALTGKATLTIALTPELTLRELVVTARPDSAVLRGDGARDLQADALAGLAPALGHGPDPLRLLTLDAGVRTAADGFGGLHVRGGGSDQNLILLDDVPVYHPTHTFGLFSIFHTSLVRSSRFYKDGFPARYDGRASSVLDVRTREGNSRQLAGEVQLGTFSSSALLEVPLVKDRAGLLLGGRRSHIGYWLDGYSARRLAGPDRTGSMRYNLYDLNLKGHYSWKRQRLFVSYYRGGDRFEQQTEVRPAPGDTTSLTTLAAQREALDWGNESTSARHNWEMNEQLFINSTLTYSDFRYRSSDRSDFEFSFFNNQTVALRQQLDYRSRIQDYAARVDADFYLDARHHLRGGVHVNRRVFTPGLERSRVVGAQLDSLANISAATATQLLVTSELTAYLEDQYTHGRWSILAGLRVAAFFHSNRRSLPWQPRLRVSYRLRPQVYLTTALTQTAQFLQLLTTADAGLPEDLWVPTPVGFAPQITQQYAVGAHGKALGLHWQLSAYHKRFQNLLRLQPELQNSGDPIRLDAANFNRAVETGEGRAAGLEATLERRTGTWRGRLTYSYLDVERRFRDAGTVFPFDSRHGANAQAVYTPGMHWQFGLVAQYQSGRSIAPDGTVLPFGPLLDPVPLAAENNRLPAYYRLDANAQYAWGERFDQRLQLAVYNVFDQRNALFARPVSSGGGPTQASAGLPRLPFLSYRLAW